MAIYTDIDDQDLTNEEADYFGNPNYFTKSGDVMAGLVYERHYLHCKVCPAV